MSAASKNKPGLSASDLLPWYRDGLRFECTQCGRCCTGSAGYVWVTEEEIVRIADHLGMSVNQFGSRYLRRACGRYALLEAPRHQDCVFLANSRCTIYEVRPKQCRTFPFWQENLKSGANWHATANDCEGIRDDAPLIDCVEIRERME